MSALVVVENTKRWPLELPAVEVVSAKRYLMEPRFSDLRGVTVYNLCRQYGYQTLGYYVSLLAAARGHRPLPSVATMQDLRLPSLLRIVSEDLEELIERSLSQLKSSAFELSIYFGRNVAQRYDRLSQALFNQFPAPFLRATFERNGRWKLDGIRAIATADIPESHREFVMERAAEYFARPARPARRRHAYRYDLAILVDPTEVDPPSDDRAIQRFVRAAHAVGIDADVVGQDDYGRIAEFDALFIRATTSVDHHTFRFARRAHAEGLVVIDDPESIVRCTNKVYQAELFERHAIPMPKTMVVHADNVQDVTRDVGLPCILKKPDSAFSKGVVKAADAAALEAHLRAFLEESDLVIAQEFVPSAFDWRVGVLDGRPLYACRYHMARGHWQIIDGEARGGWRYGRVEAVPLEQAPPGAVRLAVRCARLVGDGLYGIDVKQIGRRFLAIEVNDNPTIEAGYEDAVLKDGLYVAIMQYFRARLDSRGVRGALA